MLSSISIFRCILSRGENDMLSRLSPAASTTTNSSQGRAKPPSRNSSRQNRRLTAANNVAATGTVLPGKQPNKRSQGFAPLFARSDGETTASATAHRRSPASNESMPPGPINGEVIETHFKIYDSLYFVVHNNALSEASLTKKQSRTPVEYAVKPLWYMAGTPALQHYFKHKMKDSDKKLVPEKDTHGDNAYARKLRKAVANVFLCVVEAAPNNPETSTERCEYLLNIPSDWGQLAHFRLKHFNMDRVLSFACMPTSEDGSTPPVNVYVVCWQNETLQKELMPATYLKSFKAHQHHHEVVLNYWEEAAVQDTRMFRSAASIDFAKQETTLKTMEGDDFYLNCVHQFQARKTYKDEKGGLSKKLCTHYVYKWVNWPVSISRISSERIAGANFDRLQPEDSDEENDPPGFDEYAQVLVHDKFPNRSSNSNDKKNRPTTKKAEELSAVKLDKYCAPDPHTVFLPPNWLQLSEEYAAANEEVDVLAVIKQFSRAKVYLVKWPSYDHPMFVPSLTMRKRHCRQLVAFFEENVYLPRMQVLKPEPK